MSEFFDRIAQLPPKRLALLAMELQAKLERAERRFTEPIAVVGLGCRFPGAPTLEEFWCLLRDGVDAVREVPADRWDVRALYDPSPGAPGKMCTRAGGFLDRIDEFDPHFFGIAPREAITMDPQQRLLLEIVWEALERAGMAPDELEGSRTGVFVGISSIDFAQLLVSGDPASLDVYTASGASHAIASGRLSYTLGLHGPSISIDTACSSSLVAVHLACQSLRAGDCRMAVAAGVNLMISPETTISLSKAGMLAPDGRCKTFDAAADGFSRGEGAGAVVLKRLSDAQADGDAILALIRGTAVNQDGRSSGITAPNGPAQEAVLREALERSGLQPGDVDYVETHGTGTVLGDPIEVRALGAVFGRGRPPDRPLLIGSVKTNFGHLEAAAGIAGLIKTILALQHEQLAPHLHFGRPNPHIDWDRLPVAVTRDRLAWPRSTGRRVAGISSFGFSGTNAHVVVEEAPSTPIPERAFERPLHILTLSAKTPRALDELARRYADAFAQVGDDALGDFCFTANTGRARFGHRLAVAAGSPMEFRRKLSTWAADPAASDLQSGVVESADPPDIAFLFTGQGAQYAGMGRELFAHQPVFRRALERCDEVLAPRLGESLLPILYPDAGREPASDERLTDTRLTQPALFAIEYALAELWQSWGVRPTAVMGHSLGEYVAACVAGVFDLDAALHLVCERARLMAQLPAGGAMAAVFTDAARAETAIGASRSTVSIAAINGPAHTVLSGRAPDLAAILNRLEAAGVRTKWLKVSHAFHSPLMDPILEDVAAAARGAGSREPRIGLVSNLTGHLLRGGEQPDAEYWRRHAREPVRFADGVRALRNLGCTVFIEIGPHPVLIGMARDCASDPDRLRWLPSLRRGRPDWQQMLASLGTAWAAGAPVDWRGFDRDYARRKVVVPTYPFQRQRYWPEIAPVRDRVGSGREDWRDWLYELRWERLQPATHTDAPDLPPTPREIVARVEPLAGTLAAEHGIGIYAALYPLLDRVCMVYMLEALRQLGWQPRQNDRVRAGDLLQRLGIPATHRALVTRMFEVFAEDGLVTREADGWRVLAVPDRADPRAMMADLRTRFPACEGELGLTARCADRLVDVLRGECDPIQLLFPGGSLAEAEGLYQHAPAFRFFNALVAAVCAEASAGRAGQPVEVLEIGGGTGGTTASILPALAGRGVRYCFTDVSPLFATRARQKFAAFDFVEYRALDIEQDPAAQGFAYGRFDLVIASNVLHATEDLRGTLRRVRDLLAPGGLLVLLEGTRPQRFGDLTVGLTDGWWRFNDDVRTSYALIPAERWLELLPACGFTDPVAFPDPMRLQEALLHNQTVILARAAAVPVRQAHDAVAVLVGKADAQAVRLRDELRARGWQAIHAIRADEWAALDEETFALDPEHRDHVERLVAAIGPAIARATVIHIDALDDRSRAQQTVESLQPRVSSMCHSALALVQGLQAAQCAVPPRLVFATRGAQAVHSGDAVDPAQATLWGLGRVVALEHPELRTTLIDLDPAGDDLGAFAALLDSAAPDEQIALRGGAMFGLRLAPFPGAVHRERVTVHEGATYLVTGGLSGLGLSVAEWLASWGARHLVLMGRSAPASGAAAAIKRLRAAGVEVVEWLGDVSCRSRLEELVASIDPRLPLRGVMHCAGVTDDAGLVQMTRDRFERVLAAKVLGSWYLDRLTAGVELDHFVLFSSGASLLGSRGQANHAAANAFMDALAHRRRADGLQALSINWGAWSDIGAATRGDVIERLEAQGVRSIDPPQGLAALEHLMATGATQAAVLPIVWPDFLKHTPGPQRRLFDRFRQIPAAAGAEAPARADASELKAASPARARSLLFASVEREAARVLGRDRGDAIDPRQPLSELGLDSLMAVELRNALADLVGKPQSATLLFNFPTIAELVEHLLTELHGPSSPAEPIGEDGAALVEESRADLDELSEDQLAILLASRLGEPR